ncbi:MAG: SurA N-terminal domain-containing protein [Eggerthellaceae bacterium]|nr:SurA N-terminal domain-containing protein [Eggerthellaceae bacterium]
MKKAFQLMAAIPFACALALGLAGCDASAGTAATVNGIEIPEQAITDDVQGLREASDMLDADSWGAYLVQTAQSPADIREQYISMRVDRELVRQGAAGLGVKVDQAALDEAVESAKAGYGTEAGWQAWLESAGYTEEGYRASQEDLLLNQAVGEYFAENAKPSDADFMEYASTVIDNYDGALRSSKIVFYSAEPDKTDVAYAKAQEVLYLIDRGRLSFAEAARLFSEDVAGAEVGGDAGWDVLSGCSETYRQVLESLDVGDASEPFVDGEGGVVCIVQLDGRFDAPRNFTSISQLPDEFREAVVSTVSSQKASEAQSVWMADLRSSAAIAVNNMPAGLPYDVDVQRYAGSVAGESADGAQADAGRGGSE